MPCSSYRKSFPSPFLEPRLIPTQVPPSDLQPPADDEGDGESDDLTPEDFYSAVSESTSKICIREEELEQGQGTFKLIGSRVILYQFQDSAQMNYIKKGKTMR